MADGSIRIKTRIDNSKAKKDAEEFVKVVDDAADKAKESGKKATVDLDISKAEKEIKRLEREISKYEAMIEQLEAGKLGEYNSEREALNKSTKADMAKATSPEQKINIQSMHDTTMAQIEKKYSSILNKADQYGKIISQNDLKIQQLRNSINEIKNSQQKVNSEQKQSASETSKTASHASRLSQMIKGAKTAAGQFAKSIGVAAYGGFKKVGSVIKNTVTKGLNRAVAGIKNMGKQADNLRKKFLKIGLALIAMRSLMAGFKQIVSSALNDNEKLQNQLTAVKGVIGEALAPAINVLIQGLSQIVSFADKLYQFFTGTSLVAKYNANQTKKTADSMSDAAKSAKEYNKQMAGFDVANAFSDTSSSNSENDNTSSLFETTDLSSWLNKIINQIKSGDWYGVGETIADSINSALSKIDWSSIQTKVKTFCTNLGNAVNGFVNVLDWERVGNAIGEGLNTITSGINSFVDTVNWESVGAGISAGLNGIVEKINGEALGKTLSAKLKILTDTLYGFLNGDGKNDGFNFKNLGKKIGETINGWFDNISWEKVTSNISGGVNGIVTVLKEAVNNINKNGNISTSISSILNGIINIDWGNVGATVGDICTKLLEIINETLRKTDWEKLGRDVVQLIMGVDWVSLFGSLGESFGEICIAILDILTGFWTEMDVGALMDTVIGSIGAFIAGIDWNRLSDSLSKCAGALIGFLVEEIVSTIDFYFVEIPKKICEWFSGISDYFDSSIEDAGGNVIEGVFNGIVNWLKDVGTWIKEHILTPFIDGFKSTFDIHSPSKNPDILELGKNIIIGVFNGVVEWLKGIGSWLKENVFDKITDAWDGMKELTLSIGGKIQDSFNSVKEKWDSIKEKGKETITTIKGSVNNTFTNLKQKWDSIKNKTNISTIKGSVNRTFTNLKSKWDSLKSKVSTSTIKGKIHRSFNTAKSNWNSLKNKTTTITTKLKDSITSGIRKILNSLVSMVNKVITVLNKLPGINISKINPPMLARGGIVNNPGRGIQATIGEAGAEAVLPLQNNTEWMDIIAEKLAQRISNNGQPIVVYSVIDGKIVGKAVAKYNNQQNFIRNGGTV